MMTTFLSFLYLTAIDPLFGILMIIALFMIANTVASFISSLIMIAIFNTNKKASFLNTFKFTWLMGFWTAGIEYFIFIHQISKNMFEIKGVNIMFGLWLTIYFVVLLLSSYINIYRENVMFKKRDDKKSRQY